MRLLGKFSNQTAILLASLSCFWSSEVLAFPDVQNHWAKACIQEMTPRNLVTGYPDGNFRPQSTITRAEFAVLMLNGFPNAPIKRGSITFKDVSQDHWANSAIQRAYQRAFFTGYPGRIFQPNQPIPRVQAIAVLSDAMGYNAPSNAAATLRNYYSDASQIPNYAKGAIAAASLNSLVVNYPNVKALQPNKSATRGEIAALLCRALSIYAVEPQYIAGVEVREQSVLPLPGKLNTVPVLNSNSPELIRQGGILLSTFPPAQKRFPNAHLDYAFNGRFDIFSHHIARAETPAENHPLYQGILLHNPGNEPVTIKVLQAASYLGNPDAPFRELPPMVENPNNTVYSGPGSRVMGDVLQDVRQATFPAQLILPPKESRLLMNLPIPIQRTPASNGRSTMMRVESDGAVYAASLAMKAPRNSRGNYRPPTLSEWQNLVETGNLAGPRDSTPTPLDPPRHPTVFGRVAGVSEGSHWTARLTDNPNQNYLSIPRSLSGSGSSRSREAISYVLGTVHLITLATEQIQSARMLRRYPDTAYFAHSNYGVEYNLVLPLKNTTNQAQTVTVTFETPLKDEGGSGRLLFKNPYNQRVFFRGTVRTRYPDEGGTMQTRYVHLVQRRGEQGKPLVTLDLPPGDSKTVEVDFIYPPDVTPPQVLTVRTVEK
ncbi:DUF3370 family protein [Lusitaniella coriacea]|uniref:DUF3370 family protein n=1 Tax=Lusitaniella coriacea TaxID=1983105 RepID=UPI003CF4F7D4